jgi:hypothetical protein
MFRSALDIAEVTQTSQASWATTWLNLGTSLRKLGQLDEASSAYIKVLEIDSRSAPALGFLGLVYHLMDRLDDAIVRYHEVSPTLSALFLQNAVRSAFFPCSLFPFVLAIPLSPFGLQRRFLKWGMLTGPCYRTSGFDGCRLSRSTRLMRTFLNC